MKNHPARAVADRSGKSSRTKASIHAPAVQPTDAQGYVQLVQRIAFIAVLAALLVDSARILHSFSFRFTDGNQTVYWFAAQEFLHLHFREPFFYGQSYFSLFDALPTAVLEAAGLPPDVALPVAVEAMGLGSWLILAGVAWRRQRHTVALLAAGGPLLLTVPYGMLLAQPYQNGLFLVAVAIAVMQFRATWLGLPAGLLLAIAAILDPNSLLLSLPVLLWILLGRWRQWLYVGLLGVGLAAGAGVQELALEFYRLHPNWVLHPAPPYTWSSQHVLSGVSELAPHMRFMSLIFAPLPALVMPALAAEAIVLAYLRRLAPAAVAALGVLLALGGLGLPKTSDGSDSVHFSLQRIYLAMPLLVVFVLMIGAPRRPAVKLLPTALVTAVILVTFGYREVILDSQINQYQVAPRPDYEGVRTVTFQRSRCAAIERFAQERNAELVVFTRDPASAYACGALDYGRLQTLVPGYERRTWRLEEERSLARWSLLIADVSSDFCSRPEVERVGECSYDPVSESASLSLLQRQSSLQVIHTLGFPIRSF